MGGMGDLPATYLNATISHDAEIGLIAAAVIVGAWTWWRQRHVAQAGDPSATGSSRRTGDVISSDLAHPMVEPTMRRVLRIGFGMLWVLDGLLQAQPDMPRQFVPMVLAPAYAGTPPWLAALGRFASTIWASHIVTTDAFTVFVQVLIGLAIVLGHRGEHQVIERLGLAISIGWGLVVWVFGEGMGDILAPHASLLSGDPGGVLCYVVAALVLLAVPEDRFVEGRRLAGRIAVGLGLLLVAGAVLQALPVEGFSRGHTLAALFAASAANSQPAVLAAPITAMQHLAARNPSATNAVIVAVLAITGVALLLWRHRSEPLWLAEVVCFAAWWLGMDFGVLGGTGTDPNISLPLGIVAAAAIVGLSRAEIPASERLTTEPGAATAFDRAPARRMPVPAMWGLAATWLLLGAALATALSAVPFLESLPAAAATPSIETDALFSSGGLAAVPGSPKAPNFRLVDQNGRAVSLESFHHDVVILSFLDPVCYATCPVVAEELAQVARLLGARRSHVVFLAINANPDLTSPSLLRAFDAEHGITNLSNWYFVTGTARQLEAVWSAYGATTLVPRVGMVAHSLLVYVIGPNGHEVALTQATGVPGSKIEVSYAELFADEASSLLPRI
jgi:cytochrome oxidase Cu insertion factor (SCO1/SenC/PrrC family)